ncbi:MAG TPA: DUF6265 family protein [Ignavibacteria bacterium]|mgnify:CR=1 FL=1|nr:DUF6265 family protein [Ignavibacteria bacterium]HMR42126.1 DUF6265 family protein [Ignavibacteria bacterium]
MDKIKIFEWLKGQWEGIMGSGLYHEEWYSDDENNLTGRAYLIKSGEITNNEILKIHLTGNDVFYTADVSHNPDPVSFKLTEFSDRIFVFENPEHDFPQKIKYEIISENNFIASVEAVNEGKTRKLVYDLKRIT